MQVIPQITALQAQGLVNQFLSDRLPDRFTADHPELVTEVEWRVPVVLAYPHVGSLGEVGEVMVSTVSEEILDHTPLELMKQAGLRLYGLNRHTIEADFS
jgi:hypothetical protein